MYKIPESVLVIIYSEHLDVLLLERAGQPGLWQSVTGSKDYVGEALIATAMREVKEETGIAIVESEKLSTTYNAVHKDCLRDWHLTNQYEIYPMWRHRYAPGVVHNIEHVFSLLVPRHIVVRLAAREHVRYQWLPYVEAAHQCFSPSNAQAILQLTQYHAH